MRISDWSSDVFSSDRADRVFGVGIHLAEGLVAAIGQEDGIVAEPLVAARRPDERAVDPAFEPFDMAVGPGERERADDMRVDRKSVVWGKSVSVRVDLVGRRIIEKNNSVEESVAVALHGPLKQ